MNCTLSSPSLSYFPLGRTSRSYAGITPMARSNNRRRVPKNLRYPRREKLPPDFGVNLFLKKTNTTSDLFEKDLKLIEEPQLANDEEEVGEENNVVWDSDEIEAISSLFQGRVPQKPGKFNRQRPLPLPVPHKLRPLGLPTPKSRVKLTAPEAVPSRASIAKQMFKSPSFLVGLAREISGLNPDEDVSLILGKWVQFLRKGSLSLTIRELGHMGYPERALQTFCWAQKQPQLFPDDRILASTVEVLASNHNLKVPVNMQNLTGFASRRVLEAMVRGLIKGGNLGLAWKFLVVSAKDKRMLDSSIYAKLILELGKSPDKHMYVELLLDELGEQEELNLTQQDCTAIMKVCIKMGKFDVVERLFNWFKNSGCDPSIVMFTTVIHSRYTQKKYREALAVVWEMEASNCLFDLPAYRVVIKLFVALNDISRAVRYFSKIKEAGFSPTYDIYKDLFGIYMLSGRIAKCKEICKEAEVAGFRLDKHIVSYVAQFEREKTVFFKLQESL